MTKKDDFLQKLLTTFGIEAQEYLNAISSGLIEIEKTSGEQRQTEIIEVIYRKVHSLKGAARVVNFTYIEKVSQAMESVFSSLKCKEMPLSSALFDLLHKGLNFLSSLLLSGKTEPDDSEVVMITDIIGQLEQAAHSPPPTSPRPLLWQEREIPRAGEGEFGENEGAKSTITPHPDLLPQGEKETDFKAVEIPPHLTSPTGLLSVVPERSRREVEVRGEENDVGNGLKPFLTNPFLTGNKETPEQASGDSDTNKTLEEGVISSPIKGEDKGEGVNKISMPETIRVCTSKLDKLLLKAQEMLSLKSTTAQRATELSQIKSSLVSWKKEWKKIASQIPRSSHKNTSFKSKEQACLFPTGNKEIPPQASGYSDTDKLLNFLDWNYNFIKSLADKITPLEKLFKHDNQTISFMIDGLLEDTKEILMLPFSSLIASLPGFVRELAYSQGKKVEFTTYGESTEIDKRILEEIKDPLIHLIRNCIDHGIEMPQEREKKNKSLQGNTTLSISKKNSSHIEILVTDDGAGIDIERIKAICIKDGIFAQNEIFALKEQELISVIFQSGFSTASIITEISGRGLGLAIVKEKIEELGGSLSVQTGHDKGTTFKIILPITIAVLRGLYIKIDEKIFIIPTIYISKVMRVNKKYIKTIENREIIDFKDEKISLVHLSMVLGLQNTITDSGTNIYIVILNWMGKHIAFAINEILYEKEVMVKKLGKQLVRVKNIEGAAIAGTGQVVPVLNVPDLMKTAIHAEGNKSFSPVAVSTDKKKIRKKSVLIAEDSITSRTLLKNILESAGYEVEISVDGLAALSLLHSEKFDILVSDIEMPGINGFDLTASIRNDKKLSELPVILVTGLESREDKEHGIDIGANAYIIKSGFDQNNLLSVIERLI